MKSKKAFTLIELLVVIAIIALLLSIIMPALRKVKKQAAAIVCLANMKSMAACWHTYAMDNSEKMVNGQIPRQVFAKPAFWVEAPQNRTGTYTGEKPETMQLPIEEEQNGIRKGLLYPYLDSVDVYHCPAENGKVLFESSARAANGSFWNCYSITGMMNGEEAKEWAILRGVLNPQPDIDYDSNAAVKITEVVSPGSKIVFLENGDSRGWLMGSWLMNYETPSSWIDPFAIWHGNQSPLGFADGHAENHKWVDKTTIENAKQSNFNANPPADEREDINYFSHRYVPGRHSK